MVKVTGHRSQVTGWPDQTGTQAQVCLTQSLIFPSPLAAVSVQGLLNNEMTYFGETWS